MSLASCIKSAKESAVYHSLQESDHIHLHSLTVSPGTQMPQIFGVEHNTLSHTKTIKFFQVMDLDFVLQL